MERSVDKCIYLTPEVKAKLEDLLAPAIKLVTIGTGDNKVQVGNEEVIYRHEKTYVHPPGIAILISDKESEAKVDEKIKKIKELQFPWVGLTLKADLIALQFESGDKNKFLALVKKVSDSANLGHDSHLRGFGCLYLLPGIYVLTKSPCSTRSQRRILIKPSQKLRKNQPLSVFGGQASKN